MTEIDKMFKNAGAKPQYKKRTECKDGYTVGHPCEKGIACINCNRSVFEDVMPPFTAEKQLELIKWLSRHTYRNYIKFRFDICGLWYCECNMSNSDMHHTFEEALAQIINCLWQDLTDQEKEEIRSILNENN